MHQKEGGRVVTGLRVSTGVAWGIDAYLKWQPAFFNHVLSYMLRGSAEQPEWLGPWFHFWIWVVAADPRMVAWSTAVAETAVAISLIAGCGRFLGYGVGGALSVGIWVTAEGFGGPYRAGVTDIGCSILYAFLMLVVWQWWHLSAVYDQQELAVDHWLRARRAGRCSPRARRSVMARTGKEQHSHD